MGRNWRTARELFRTPLRDSCESSTARVSSAYPPCRSARDAVAPHPAERTAPGATCVGVRTTDTSATALFEDGSEFEADVIVGCDGVRSIVRATQFGDEKARYTGHMCWRALVPVADFPLKHVSPDSSFWMGPNSHIVTYYVRGGDMVNIVAVKEHPDWVEESWTIPGSKQELLDAFRGWHPNIQELLRGRRRGQHLQMGPLRP